MKKPTVASRENRRQKYYIMMAFRGPDGRLRYYPVDARTGRRLFSLKGYKKATHDTSSWHNQSNIGGGGNNNNNNNQSGTSGYWDPSIFPNIGGYGTESGPPGGALHAYSPNLEDYMVYEDGTVQFTGVRNEINNWGFIDSKTLGTVGKVLGSLGFATGNPALGVAGLVGLAASKVFGNNLEAAQYAKSFGSHVVDFDAYGRLGSAAINGLPEAQRGVFAGLNSELVADVYTAAQIALGPQVEVGLRSGVRTGANNPSGRHDGRAGDFTFSVNGVQVTAGTGLEKVAEAFAAVRSAKGKAAGIGIDDDYMNGSSIHMDIVGSLAKGGFAIWGNNNKGVFSRFGHTVGSYFENVRAAVEHAYKSKQISYEAYNAKSMPTVNAANVAAVSRLSSVATPVPATATTSTKVTPSTVSTSVAPSTSWTYESAAKALSDRIGRTVSPEDVELATQVAIAEDVNAVGFTAGVIGNRLSARPDMTLSEIVNADAQFAAIDNLNNPSLQSAFNDPNKRNEAMDGLVNLDAKWGGWTNFAAVGSTEAARQAKNTVNGITPTTIGGSVFTVEGYANDLSKAFYQPDIMRTSATTFDPDQVKENFNLGAGVIAKEIGNVVGGLFTGSSKVVPNTAKASTTATTDVEFAPETISNINGDIYGLSTMTAEDLFNSGIKQYDISQIPSIKEVYQQGLVENVINEYDPLDVISDFVAQRTMDMFAPDDFEEISGLPEYNPEAAMATPMSSVAIAEMNNPITSTRVSPVAMAELENPIQSPAWSGQLQGIYEEANVLDKQIATLEAALQEEGIDIQQEMGLQEQLNGLISARQGLQDRLEEIAKAANISPKVTTPATTTPATPNTPIRTPAEIREDSFREMANSGTGGITVDGFKASPAPSSGGMRWYGNPNMPGVTGYTDPKTGVTTFTGFQGVPDLQVSNNSPLGDIPGKVASGVGQLGGFLGAGLQGLGGGLSGLKDTFSGMLDGIGDLGKSELAGLNAAGANQPATDPMDSPTGPSNPSIGFAAPGSNTSTGLADFSTSNPSIGTAAPGSNTSTGLAEGFGGFGGWGFAAPSISPTTAPGTSAPTSAPSGYSHGSDTDSSTPT